MDKSVKVKQLRPLLDSVKAVLDSLKGKPECKEDPRVAQLKAMYTEYRGGCHRAVVIKL